MRKLKAGKDVKKTVIETDIVLGETYTCKVTKIIGVAVAVSKWQYGCIRVALQQEVNKDGNLPEALWVDEPQLEGVTPKQPSPGGPITHVTYPENTGWSTV